MLLTISIDTSNYKAQAFIDFIRTLDFIKIDENDEGAFDLSAEQKIILDDRKQKHLRQESKSYRWEDIKNELRNL